MRTIYERAVRDSHDFSAECGIWYANFEALYFF